MRSMTGYANFTCENDLFKLAIEIKSVNNKNLNLKIKLPYILNFLENNIKTQVSNEINRGSVDLRIDFEDKREVEDLYNFDKNSAKAYMKLLDNMEKEFKMKFDNKLETLLRTGNIVKKVDLNIDETLYSHFVLGKVNEAIQKINKMKLEEGKRLEYYFHDRLEVLISIVCEIKFLREKVIDNYRTKLIERVNKVREDIQFKEEDILKEILLFADRSDISEELSRLDSHIKSFKELISSGDFDMGKKMDFILQEIFRELNTTGVKSNSYDISKIIVDAKAEVEKMREQSMNIE